MSDTREAMNMWSNFTSLFSKISYKTKVNHQQRNNARRLMRHKSFNGTAVACSDASRNSCPRDGEENVKYKGAEDLAPVVQTMDSVIHLLNNWGLVIRAWIKESTRHLIERKWIQGVRTLDGTKMIEYSKITEKFCSYISSIISWREI